MKQPIVFILFFVLMFSGISMTKAAAQSAANSGIPHMVVQYADELQLTDDQKTAFAKMSMNLQRQPRTAMRGSRQGVRRGDMRQNRQPQNRGRRSIDVRESRTEQINDILTDEQIATLSRIRADQAESAHEFRTLRHSLLVERTELPEQKASQTLDVLNRQSELRLELALKNIGQTGTLSREERMEWVTESRKLQDDLKNLLTAAEYEKLQSQMGPGHRAGWQMDRRSRTMGR